MKIKVKENQYTQVPAKLATEYIQEPINDRELNLRGQVGYFCVTENRKIQVALQCEGESPFNISWWEDVPPECYEDFEVIK